MATSAPLTGRRLAALRIAHLVTGLYLTLGLLAALRTGLDHTAELAIFVVTPSVALCWLVIGLVGGAMGHTLARAERYLLLAGPVALLLAAGGLFNLGTPFSSDPQVVMFHALTGVAALAGVGLVRGAPGLRPRPRPSAGAPD